MKPQQEDGVMVLLFPSTLIFVLRVSDFCVGFPSVVLCFLSPSPALLFLPLHLIPLLV